MTSALTTRPELSEIPNSAPGERPRDIDSGPRRRRILAAVLLPPVGAVLILLSYHIAAGMDEPGGGQFALFWVGYLSGMLSLVALACARGIDGTTRACALAGIGLFGIVPRLLRTPIGPGGSDEWAHMRQIIEALLAGDVGHVSYLLPITKDFPGLHQAVSAFARLTGLAPWLTAVTVVSLAHILSVLAVYQLCRLLGIPARGAAAGAVMYTLNPSWQFFHTAVAYESLALPLLLWCLAATIAAGRATQKPAVRSMAAALLGVLALPVVHHLTSIMLVAILVLLIVVRVLFRFRSRAAGPRPQRERIWPLLVILACLLESMNFWWSGISEKLLNYLSPAWTRAFSQFKQMLDGTAVKGAHGKRGAFSDSLNPPYEIISGYLFPFIMLALFLGSVMVLWRYRHRVGSAMWAFAVLGAMFFLSLPVVLTSGGAEGAHRSWGYSFIGIAVLFGLAWSLGPRSSDSSATRLRSVRRALGRPGAKAAVVATVFTLLSFGSAALGTNVSYRFPGGAHVGDDTRSMSKEGAAVSAWLAERASVDTPVIADRYVSLRLGSEGRLAALKPGATFPIWDLYVNAEPIRPIVLKQILDARIRYFVVDARMGSARPRVGYWFTKDEPGVGGKKPFPQAALDRFNCLPWLRAVYGAGPLTVYEVNPDVLRRTAAGSCERPAP
jgi:hypothetical protein